MSTATEAEMLAAVEQWARVRGFWRLDQYTSDTWLVAPDSPMHADSLLIWAHGESVGKKLSPAVALAWAILVESEPPPVDVGPCRTCRGRRRWSWWEQGTAYRSAWLSWAQLLDRDPDGGGSAIALAGAPWSEGSLLFWERVGQTEQYRNGVVVESTIGGWRSTVSGTCPACSGTGRNLVPVPRLLLDATTDATARDVLDVHAEVKLRDRGDPLGELLGWALVLWAGEPTDCGECPTCDGGGWPNEDDDEGDLSCPDCGGLGHQLGYPHTGEAVRWLERGEL